MPALAAKDPATWTSRLSALLHDAMSNISSCGMGPTAGVAHADATLLIVSRLRYGGCRSRRSSRREKVIEGVSFTPETDCVAPLRAPAVTTPSVLEPARLLRYRARRAPADEEAGTTTEALLWHTTRCSGTLLGHTTLTVGLA